MKASHIRALLPALFIAGLNACGGGGGSLLAGGGISGTGTGTITGFGSVIINDIRTFEIDASTQIMCDGELITVQELVQRGPGSVVTYTVRDDVNADMTAGTAATIDIGNIVKGPVTSLAPLQVLGQTVVITADTVYYEDDNPAARFSPALDDEIEINGFADVNGTIVVSRIERITTGMQDWKIIGTAAAPASSGSFNIGAQEVDLGAVIPRNCTGNMVVPGDFVEVKAAPVAPFTAGDILTPTDVECITPGLAIPPNATGTVLEAEVEGLVTTLSLPQLVINGQTVVTTVGTVYEGGTAGDIEIGSKLEAEGDLDTTSGTLTADKIRFRDRRVRIEAPVNVPGTGLGNSFLVMDVISVNTNSLTDDGDGLIDGSGNSGNLQVEVRGYLDVNDNVIATEVRDRGQARPDQVRLRGPVDGNTCDPLAAPVPDLDFGVLGVRIDTASALAFADLDGSALNQVDFCTLATSGTFVQVEDGEFFSSPARIENADLIEIED